MTDDDRATLRRLREVLEPMDPEGWFITRDLPTARLVRALHAVEQDAIALARHERALGTSHWLDTALEAEDAMAEEPLPSAEQAASAHFPDDDLRECRTCGHHKRNHVAGRCRAHRCGCGGWA